MLLIKSLNTIKTERINVFLNVPLRIFNVFFLDRGNSLNKGMKGVPDLTRACESINQSIELCCIDQKASFLNYI